MPVPQRTDLAGPRGTAGRVAWYRFRVTFRRRLAAVTWPWPC